LTNASNLQTLLENFGRYVAVDCDSGNYRIGDSEREAEAMFVAEYGTDRKVVLFHIGYY